MRKLWLLAWLSLPAFSQSAFVPGTAGCWEIHCDSHEDDAAVILPPLTNFGLTFADTSINSFGSGGDIGASSNGSVMAVTYNASNTLGRMYVYGPTGTFLWSDQTSGSSTMIAGGCSAPIVDASGGVMSADYQYIYRWSSTGALLWKTQHPYYGIVSTSNSIGNYACGGLKVLSNGVVVIKSVKGPLAAYNSATGALLGPAGCSGATCAFWPGQTPGTFSATTDYYVPVKEGGCSTVSSDSNNGYNNRIYDAMQGTGAGTPVTLPATQGIMMAFDASPTTGLSVGAQSATFTAESIASPMCHAVNGSMQIYSDIASCSQSVGFGCTMNGIATQAAVMGWVDNGSSLGPASGFPVYLYNLTAQTPALAITGGSFNASSNVVTFQVSNATATTGCVAGDALYVTGQTGGAAVYNGNWTITSTGVGAHAISVAFTGPSVTPTASGTMTCNNGRSIQANFALDSRGCMWAYVSANNAIYCVDLQGNNTTVAGAVGAADYTISFPAGFIPGETALTVIADKTMSINPANGHNIMTTALGGTGAYVVAIDANTQRLLWYSKTGASAATNSAQGQFPSLTTANGNVVAFTNSTTGVSILGQGGVIIQ
jgi:hypothetical protein